MSRKMIVLALCISSLLITISPLKICYGTKNQEDHTPYCDLCTQHWIRHIAYTENEKEQNVYLCKKHFEKLRQKANSKLCDYPGCNHKWKKHIAVIPNQKLHDLFLCEYHSTKVNPTLKIPKNIKPKIKLPVILTIKERRPHNE